MIEFRFLDRKANGWGLVFGFMVLFVAIFMIVGKVLQYTQGVFMYPFDDTFIHLTLADNLLKGNWGINENEFASASSSILYTLILSFCRIFSKSVLVPFIVNCLAGVIAMISIHFWLRRHLSSFVSHAFIFFSVIFFTPLPLLIVSGMEHTMQCLFSFLFVFHFSDWLGKANTSESAVLRPKILFYAVLVALIRYEGLFLIAIACLLMLIRRKILQTFILGGVSILPLLIFGLISMQKGSYFLPNSVLVKSGSFEYLSPFQLLQSVIFDRLVQAKNGMATLATQRLLIILPLMYLTFKKLLQPSFTYVLFLLMGATVLQLSFASTGYLYRYEAYLFFCAMIIVPVILFKNKRYIFNFFSSNLAKFFGLVLFSFLFLPVILRSATALNKTSQACINIYDQQYQMATFTKKYYQNNSIALNDIGAVSYFAKANIIDLWGLASFKVTESKKQHYWSPSFLDSLCRANKVSLAIIYDSWFPKDLTKRWTKAATWQIKNNVICGDSIVSFYGIDSASGTKLQQQLRGYEAQLPSSVLVKYY